MIHRAKDLSPDQKRLIENLLGRAVATEDAISIRAISPVSAPEWLRASWESAERLGLDKITPDEIDAEIQNTRAANRQSQQSSER